MLSFFCHLRGGLRPGAGIGLVWRDNPGKTLICFRENRSCFCFFAVCGAAFVWAQGLAWCSEANLASFDLFQGNPIVLLLFSLSAGRPSTGRKAWCGETNLASFDLFQGNAIVLLFFSLSAGRPSTGRKAWCGKANLAKL